MGANAILALMKRTRFWMIGAFVVVSALLAGVAIETRQQPLNQLKHYSQTPAFTRYVSDVFDAREEATSATGSLLLTIDEPVNSTFDTLAEYKIRRDSKFDLNISEFPDGNNQFTGTARSWNLSSQQFTKLKSLVAQLPPSSAPEKREHLLVTFTYKPRQIRLYDRRKPPLQIREIITLLTNEVKRQDDKISQRSPRESRLGDDFPHMRSPLRLSQMPKTP